MGAMAASAAAVRMFSDDGHCVHDPLIMRRALEYVKPFDAVVAQHAEDPRLTVGRAGARGRGRRAAGPDRLARGRRGVDRRARRDARRGRRRPAARLPRLDGGLGRGAALGASARGQSASPPRSPRTTCCSPTTCAEGYDPVYKVNPPLRPAGRLAGAAARARRRRDRLRRHRPRPARGGGQGLRVGDARPGMLGLQTALVGRRCDDGRGRPARLGAASPSGCAARPRRGSRRWPTRADRSRPAEPANLVAGRPRRPLDGRAGPELASPARNTPYAGMDAAGSRGRHHAAADDGRCVTGRSGSERIRRCWCSRTGARCTGARRTGRAGAPSARPSSPPG